MYPNANDISIHTNRIIEGFRDSDKYSYEISDVKEILDKIKY
jgi:hypothetical protein